MGTMLAFRIHVLDEQPPVPLQTGGIAQKELTSSHGCAMRGKRRPLKPSPGNPIEDNTRTLREAGVRGASPK